MNSRGMVLHPEDVRAVGISDFGKTIGRMNDVLVFPLVDFGMAVTKGKARRVIVIRGWIIDNFFLAIG